MAKYGTPRHRSFMAHFSLSEYKEINCLHPMSKCHRKAGTSSLANTKRHENNREEKKGMGKLHA